MSEAKDNSAEYPELMVPPSEEEHVADGKKETEPRFSPLKMRRFVKHLSSASTKVHTQIKAKADIRERLERIKSMALNKRTKKAEIESEFSDFQSLVHDIIMDEQKILDEQRRETKEIRSLKEMVEDLSKKLVDLGDRKSVV